MNQHLPVVLALALCASSASAQTTRDASEPTSQPAAQANGGQPAGEPSPSDVSGVAAPAGYAEAIQAALREHEHGNYEESRVHFQRAHELYPNARTLRGLGKVEFELRNYGEAVRYLEQALASPVKPLDEALRSETERLLTRARVYVGEVHVDVEPGSATVSVDGVTVASGPKASMSLLVGDHTLEFHAQGRLPQRRVIRVRGGEQTVVQVVLPAQEPLAANRSHQTDETPLRKKWWVWTAAGALAASVAVGIAVAASNREPSTRAATGGTSNTIVEGL